MAVPIKHESPAVLEAEFQVASGFGDGAVGATAPFLTDESFLRRPRYGAMLRYLKATDSGLKGQRCPNICLIPNPVGSGWVAARQHVCLPRTLGDVSHGIPSGMANHMSRGVSIHTTVHMSSMPYLPCLVCRIYHV